MAAENAVQQVSCYLEAPLVTVVIVEPDDKPASKQTTAKKRYSVVRRVFDLARGIIAVTFTACASEAEVECMTFTLKYYTEGEISHIPHCE